MAKRKIIIFIIILIGAFLLGGGPQWLLKQYAFSMTEETDTHLFYILKKDNKPYIVRCEKAVKARLSDYHLYNKRARIISNLLSSQDDLPSKEEDAELNKLEVKIVDAVVANNEKEFVLGGYVTGAGEKELFLYANNLNVLNEIFKNLKDEFPTHNLKLDVQEDGNWNYYNAFCEKKEFPI